MGILELKNAECYEKTFELKQHTPIIHFQYAQKGATLRATEVKPKLDRFLKKRLDEELEKKWFLKDSGALDYSLSFISPDSDEIEIGYKTDYDIYYGNMGENTRTVKALMVKPGAAVRMRIVCRYTQLLELIAGNIRDFFLVTNFGRMQDKGFGSFSVEGESSGWKAVSSALCREYGANACYFWTSGGKPFKEIKTVYGIMKSGVNYSFKGLYRRSLLFLYMHEKYGIGNEKAFLKQKGIAPIKGRNDKNQLDENSHYVRALLGVGDTLSFQNAEGKGKTAVSISSAKIDRLASPIFFKIIDNTVYFVGGRINKAVLGASFEFKARASKSLTVPDAADGIDENFLDGFLEYAVKSLNETDRAKLNGQTPLKGFDETKRIDKIETVRRGG